MMHEKKPTYEQMEKRLTEAEQVFETIESGQTDALISNKRVMLLRLKEAEEALRASEQRYRLFVEKNPEAVFQLDRSGQIVDVNPVGERLTGYRGFELQEMSWADLCMTEDVAAMGQLLEMSTKEESFQRQMWIRQKNGEQRLVYLTAGPMAGVEGVEGVEGVFLIGHDVTEAKKREEDLRVHQAELEMQNDQLRRTQAELEQSHTRYTALFDFAPTGYFILDTKGMIENVNLTGAAMLGTERPLVMRRPLSNFTAKESLETYYREHQKVFREGRYRRCELKMMRNDGVEFYGEVLFEPERGEDGLVRQCRAAVIDITERKRAEETLVREREVLQSIIDNIPVMLVMWEPGLERFTLNRHAQEVLGWTSEEANEGDFMRLVYPDEAVRKQVSEFMQSLSGQWHEWEARTKAGEAVPTEWTNVRLTDETMIGIGIDLRERKAAERELRESEARLQVALEAGRLGVYEWDASADKAYWGNERMYEIFGRRPEEGPLSKAELYERVIVREDQPMFEYELTEAMAKKELFQMEVRIRRQNDGQLRWIEYSGRFEETAAGNMRLVGVVADVTKRKVAETALRENESRLRLAAEAAHFGTYEADLVTGELYWSEQMRAILGVGPEGPSPVPGKVPECVHPEDKEHVREMMQAGYDPEGSGKMEDEHRIVRPGGEVRWVMVRGQVDFGVVKGQRRAVRSRGILLDITARKRVEEEIHNIARFPEEDPFPVLRLQRDGTIIYSNKPGEVVLKEWERNVGEKAPEAWCEQVKKALKDEQYFVEEMGCGERCYSLAVTPLVREGYVNVYGQDITARRAAQAALERLNQTLEQRIEERTGELKESIDELNRTKSSLLQAHRIARLGNWEWDFERGIFWCSEQVYRILGLEPGETGLTYETFLMYVHPEDVDRVREAVNEVLKSQGTVAAEHRILRPDGSERLVQERAEVTQNAAGKAVLITGTIQDITAEREREARLQRQDMTLRSQAELLDLAHDAIFVHDLEGKIIFWNQGAEKVYGWKREEVLGTVMHDVLKTRFAEPLMKLIASVSTRGTWEGELVHQTREGELITVESRWALQKDEEGRPAAILEIDRDITERKAAQQRTEEARHYAESIIETIEEAILVLDAELKVLSANKTFYDIFGMAPSEVIGTFVYDLAEGHWQAWEFRRLLEGIIPQHKKVDNYEIEYEGNKGAITLLLNAKEIFENQPDQRRILLAFHDITTHKLQEKALKELTEELLQAEEYQRQEVATALHDSVGQMLAFSKRELAQLLKNPDLRTDKRLSNVLDSINQSIRQSRELTADLSSPTLQAFGLKAGLEELAEDFEEKYGFRCRLSFADDPEPLETKVETLLYRSVKELLCNISKHAEASLVGITVRKKRNYLEVRVRDDGQGFDTARLVRNDDRKNNCFGLFSIQQRLTNIGGAFRIESEEGNGTQVVLEVPMKR